MARSLSSMKRMRQNERRKMRNKTRRSALKSQITRFTAAAATGAASAEAEFRKAVKLLDRAGLQKTIHKNTAARRKSRLAKQLNRLKAAKS